MDKEEEMRAKGLLDSSISDEAKRQKRIEDSRKLDEEFKEFEEKLKREFGIDLNKL